MDLHKFLLSALLLSLLNYASSAAKSWEEEDFLKTCPSHRCSKHHGPEIRHLVMNVIPLVYSSSSCPLQKLISTNQSTDVYRPIQRSSFDSVLVGCSIDSIATNQEGIVGPSSCLSLSNNASQFWYLVLFQTDMSTLPLGCEVVAKSIPIPYTYDKNGPKFGTFFGKPLFKDRAKGAIDLGETPLNWNLSSITSICQRCEQEGRHCGFSSDHGQAFCQHHGSNVKLIAATTSVATFIVLVTTALYLLLKKRYNEEIHLKVEMFLKTYDTSKPTRYTFSEVKKIARRFKEKVGQGGFGSVYKGQLPNGVPVAVKMLENSRGKGEDFINEVATIGQIHHANIVRLLGFCSEGTRRALIYEFMPNESLERYIFLHDSRISQELLVPHKMLEIAKGIARGMEYLHQGCNQRILHFDIKPHNILLDYSFNPKISDFGLAKLCARDQSIVTLTAARGTMGYIAPEIYSRNFGGISYKSDVYSFGMLVLEMLSGRRNSDPGIENQNEVYLPQWIYERVIAGQDLVLHREITKEEKEKVKQMAIVALWCMQWNPKNRPSMTKVVNMLTGRLQNLHIPPKPYI
ncbi:hypothetical protein GQ55_5G454500 [Panicum hallii var. hallii]|uniref:non-specific serine/threonine protein kinase n=1 Tax=Panicum hallii var. hallii TaxID=1504633 RepID=A0A2T7DQ86_9POAL|nr:hypothetical protein GQ55_5G454500 [Panicum hallii var. hallii]